MSIFVFVGPTLPDADAQKAELQAVYLPPVAQGDVYRLALKKPRAIGIVDGYFEAVPSVWHKEILWAMAQGIHVFGSASIGALRAAELANFGMEGVGKIFEAYASGVLEDDDEVAVAHGAREAGYPTYSVAMVNIRATLARAEEQELIGDATRQSLETIGKGLFYAERSYPRILQIATEQQLPDSEIAEFQQWLPTGEVNQKKIDAIEMLRLMRDHLSINSDQKRVRFSFQYTDMWDQTVHSSKTDSGSDIDSDTPVIDHELVLDELRLKHQRYTTVREGATLRLLALAEARRQGKMVTDEALQGEIVVFLRERNLAESEQIEAWLEKNGLRFDQFAQLVADEVLLRWIQMVSEKEISSFMLDHLRISNEYSELMDRARKKQQVLEARGLPNISLADVKVTQDELLRWYFNDRLSLPLPKDVRVYAHKLGYEDEQKFQRTILREFIFCGPSI